MNFYKITTRHGPDVVKTFMIQAYDKEDAQKLTDRLFTTGSEKIMHIDDKTELLDDLDVKMNEYMRDWNDDVEFVFWTGGRTPSLTKRSEFRSQ